MTPEVVCKEYEIMASLVKRNRIYYLQYYVGRKLKRKCLSTSSYQIAKEKLREFESAQLKGEKYPLTTQTRLEDIVSRYVDHIRTVRPEDATQAGWDFGRNAGRENSGCLLEVAKGLQI